ncbi:MAG: DUF1588 domain-containing protein [Planctomycetia bacterium]|nr:DUF1588 domain-containing protein [Planctomycetia bacterium]
MSRHSAFSWCLILAAAMSAATAAAEPFEAFLQQHCLRCHGPDLAERDLRIDQLSRDFAAGTDGHLWAEIVERINAGEMPPEEEPQPTVDAIAAVVGQLDTRIREGRAARMAARPPVTHYRLSRVEYQHTVYDLLGVRYDPTKPGELNADPRWHGFERIGSELSLSPSHVERYYRAAETVLNRAFPTTPIETRTVRKTAADLRYGGGKMQQEYLERFGIERPLRALIFPGRTQQAFRPHWFGHVGPEASGLYRARMQVSGIRPRGGQIAHLRIGKPTVEAANEGLVELDIVAPEDAPQVIEFEVFLEMPTSLDFNVVATDIIDRQKGAHYRNALSKDLHIFTHSSETKLLNPTAPKMFDEAGNGLFSCVLLDWIEWEGPIETEAERQARSGLMPPADADAASVTAHLQRFTERAWRRPVAALPPDGKLYPDYDVWLEASMREEVVGYFREVFRRNLSIDAFLTSDWTIANPRLCDFYGLPEPEAGGFQRVSLRPDDHRGGLLTMGGILGLTSDGTRHRPVHRGVWVSEAIFGKTPPPPPANVDPIEPNPPDSPKATIRQKLAAHATNASCAACHRSIDPLGLAFDQFDAIGQWRTHERVAQGTGGNPPVDASGQLPDGRAFADADSFKELLVADHDRFLEALVEQLSTYALRRVLTVDDRDELAAIVAVGKAQDYRLRDLIRAVALSDLMQQR